jgi:23S rRNA pseudouridine2605 synthase
VDGGRRGRVPLERALSKLGLASRSEARGLVVEGRVRVEGEIVTDPLIPVVPESARIAIDGETRSAAPFRCLMLDKPRGVVTTRSDPEGRSTVFDLLGEASAGLAAVGRLDLASTGLLLLTNQTRLADWLTDPSQAIVRTYLVTVRGEAADTELIRLAAGVEEGGEWLKAASIRVRKRSKRETHLVVELREGRNREVRRLFASAGREVTRLRRVAFGGLELGSLSPGEHREVTAEELRRAFGPGLPLDRGPVRP